MPPQKRKCASCRYFQSNQLSGNGWCTHPERQTSSDVRILVRKDELACRNSWGNDLWVSATGEQPVAAPAGAERPAPLPIALHQRDDRITSVIHRDAPQAVQSLDDVARDDIMVVEASLVPERRDVVEPENDSGNSAAHEDQARRAQVLARGGTHSAIQSARERMAARRTPQARPGAALPSAEDMDDIPSDPEDQASASSQSQTAVPERARAGGSEDTDADLASTPVEAPIRPQMPRAFGVAGRMAGNRPPTGDAPSTPADDDDEFNSIPEVDPTIDLPLREHSAPASEPQPGPFSGVQEAEPEPHQTIYDAVLEQARAIRAASGKDTPTPVAPGHAAADSRAREEKRARRLVHTVPASTVSNAPAAQPPVPTATARMADTGAADDAPHRPQTPTVAGRGVAEGDGGSRRPRTFAELRRQEPDSRTASDLTTGHPAGPAGASHAAAAPRRMGIPIGTLKAGDRPAPHAVVTPVSEADTAPAPVRPAHGVSFNRVPLGTQPEPAEDRHTERHSTMASHPEQTDYREDGSPVGANPSDPDDYQPIEEPLDAMPRGPFGRFRNPWRKDREAIRERQIMATVREAISVSAESPSDPFADLYEEAEEASPPQVTSVATSTDQATAPSGRDDDVASNNPDRERGDRPAPPGRDYPARRDEPLPQTSPSRSHGLYRPVHEGTFSPNERGPDHRSDIPGGTGRHDRGNGATVLRVRAESAETWDEVDDLDGSPSGRERALGQPERIDDAFAGGDDAPHHDRFPSLGMGELQMQPVETLVTPATESAWSFAPLHDLDSAEGMDVLRSRVFGGESTRPTRPAAATSATTATIRRPGDDVVLEVPPHAETLAAGADRPRPPKDSPLRSANYRGGDPAHPGQQGQHITRPVSTPSSSAPAPSRRSQRPLEYREEPGNSSGRSRPAESDHRDRSFDIRDVLAGGDEDLDLGVSIAPDVPRACRTCRDYRPSEHGDRGFCANNWAFAHRQMVNADGLPCTSSIGCWWLPSDRIWMPEERPDAPVHRVDEMTAAPRRRQSG